MGIFDEWLKRPDKPDPRKMSEDAIRRVDRYDRDDLNRIAKEMKEFRSKRDKLCDVAPNTGGHLTSDAFFSFYKVEPDLEDPAKMRPSFMVNWAVAEELQGTTEWERLRSWTEADIVSSAMAFVSIEDDLEALFDKCKKHQEQTEQLETDLIDLINLEGEQRSIDELIAAWQEGDDEGDLAGMEERQRQLAQQIAQAGQKISQQGQHLQEQIDAAVGGSLNAIKEAMGEAADDAENLASAANSFGLDAGQLQRMSAPQRIALAERLNGNERFKKLAELIGPMQRIAAAEQTRKIIHANEEVFDIGMGNDLSRVLPGELLGVRHPILRRDFQRKFIEGKLLQYEMRGEEKVGKGGIIFCVDAATQILTTDGWKSYNELHVGDVALTLNHATGTSEWQPVQKVTRFPAERRRMLQMFGRRHSSLTTADHRWPVITGKNHRRAWRTSVTLGSDDRLIPNAPCANLPTDPKYTDALVQLVAWAMTEGTILPPGNALRIYQSERTSPANCQTIDALLRSLYGGPTTGDMRANRGSPAWHRTVNNATGIASFQLNRLASEPILAQMDADKVIPTSFVRDLTLSQLRLFIDACVDGDGDRTRSVDRFRQKNPDRLAAFELAAILAGISVSTKPRSVGDFEVSLSRRQPADLWMPSHRWVEHEGIVWCPTTPNTTWLARRNGTVFFTGNCMDNSGSMGGENEIWAKAVGLATMSIAKEQRRSFIGFHFGSRRELMKFDFSKPELMTFEKVIDYAEFFFGGGPLRTDQQVVTPDGWKRIGDIESGDHVFGPDGQPVGVTGVYPQGVLTDMYRVTFKDGAQVVCDATHLWTVKDRGPHGYNAGSRFTKARTMRLSEIIATGLNTVNGYRFFVPMTEAVELPPVSLPLDPYLVGYLIGNGGFTHTSPAVTPTPGDEHPWERLLPSGVQAVQTERRPGFADTYLLTTGPRGGVGRVNPLTDALRSLGLWGHDASTKFIPEQYLWGSVEQRWALLQGLCDSDGSYSQPGRLEYGTVSERLAKGVVHLVQSLGGVATITIRPGRPNEGTFFRVFIVLNGDDCPFRLNRKVNQWQPRHHDYIRSIVAVEPVEDAECICIKVDREDGLFLTEGFVVTHNTDFVRPLTESLKVLQAEEKAKGFVEGDIIFVTDGQCHVPDQWLADFKKEQERLAFKVWGVLIGPPSQRTRDPLWSICDHNVVTISDMLSADPVRDMFRDL